MSHAPSLAIILKCADKGHVLSDWYGINKGPFDPAPRQEMRSCNCMSRYETRDAAWLIEARHKAG